MKLISLVASHKIIASAFIVGIIGITAGATIVLNKQSNETTNATPAVTAKTTKEENIPTKGLSSDAKAAADSLLAESIKKPEVAPKVKPETKAETKQAEPAQPTVLSTQEYGKKYLNLSNPKLQECFNAIVSVWPERFTPEARERNVKALSVWASPCAAGIDSPRSFYHFKEIGDSRAMNIVYLYKAPNGAPGWNGEFFDSGLANSAGNR